MFRRTIWYGLIASAILLAMTATAVSAATYTDPKGRFTVAIPSGWEADNDPDPFTILYVAPNGRHLGFGVIATDEAVPGKSGDLVQNIVDLLGDAFDGPSDYTIQAVTLGGQPATRAERRGHINGEDLRVIITASVVGGTTYVLLFLAAEAEYPAAGQAEQAIYDSFRYLKVPVVTTPITAPQPPPATGVIRRLGDG